MIANAGESDHQTTQQKHQGSYGDGGDGQRSGLKNEPTVTMLGPAGDCLDV